MEQNACVSIVVPVYNQEVYLDASIPALINQSYKNLQIILVNDGSTDTSAEILKRYAALDSRIKIVEKENGGLVDATLAGISVADSEYLCFLDPDDLVGKNFVQTFIENMTDACDFVAAGYYTENKGMLIPYPLIEDRLYTANELRGYANNYLWEQGYPGVSHRFFISRWNKLYRTKLVKKVAEQFSQFRHITLGEDSIFTYLMLLNSQGGKTVSQPNSYFYNIGNTNSMMKTGQIETYLSRAFSAFSALKELTVAYSTDDSQAYALYGFLLNTLVVRIQKSNALQYSKLCKMLKTDNNYQKASSLMRLPTSRIGKVKSIIKQFIPDSFIHLAKRIVAWMRTKKAHILFWWKKCQVKGPIRASRLLGYQKDREKAFQQMKLLLPKMEKHIYPFLKPYLSETTNLDECPLVKKIFVFWWDGFENAPKIVQLCLASIRKNHSDCCVIPIDKNNFKDYTDIHPEILQAFYADKISVQTFSDILRFNLLKNNGGIWIDATILFPGKFNLLEDLETKTFTTLAFATSQDFLTYEDTSCSWSGFFIASRKNSLFVRAVDSVFQQYFLKYRTYRTYFFIDITMMLCKKYGLDANALDKTIYTSRNMFALAPFIHKPFDANVWEFIGAIPQKLAWNISDITTDNSFYRQLLSEYSLE